MDDNVKGPAPNFLKVFIKEEVCDDNLSLLTPNQTGDSPKIYTQEELLSPFSFPIENSTNDNVGQFEEISVKEEVQDQEEPVDLTLANKLTEVTNCSDSNSYKKAQWDQTTGFPGGSTFHLSDATESQDPSGPFAAFSESTTAPIKDGGVHQFQCQMCSKNFTFKWVLMMHYRTHTGEKPFECDICRKRFAQKSNLTTHYRTHTGEKSFECDICRKRFIQKCTLTIHKRTHTGEKSFVCDTCEKKCISKDSLSKHMLIHSTEKPFVCDTCGKKFSQKPYLKLHHRIHTGKPYACNICAKRFIKSSNLNRHLKSHT